MTLEKNPKVAILLPCFNASEFLIDSLESIRAQSYSNFLVICVDDCSTDDTYALLKKIAAEDNRFVVSKNRINLGVASTLNQAIELIPIDCGYVARFDADDINQPNRIEEQVRFLESKGEIDVCGSWMSQFGDREGEIKYPVEHRKIVREMVKSNPIGHPSVMIRAKWFVDNGLRYDSKFIVEDFELWIRLLLDHGARFHNIPKFLVRYRAHEKQVTNEKFDEVQREFKKIRRKLFKRKPLLFFRHVRKNVLREPRFLRDVSFLRNYVKNLLYRARVSEYYQRRCGAHLANDLIIDNRKNCNFVLGQGVVISEKNYITLWDEPMASQESFLSIGSGTYIGQFNNIRAAGSSIRIGSNCLISQFVTMVGTNHGTATGSLMIKQTFDRKKSGIEIGDDVWIGANVVILPGSRIGDGVVVGAGSVVSGHLEPFGIYAGSPAKLLKFRSPAQTSSKHPCPK